MRKEPAISTVRVDQWLHAARFFKTRALSAHAIKSGRVLLNQGKVKPSHSVKPGDILEVRRGDERMEFAVLELSKRRGPASVAATLYAETEQSQRLRAEQQDGKRFTSYFAPSPERRPDKKSRRQLIDLQRGKE